MQLETGQRQGLLRQHYGATVSQPRSRRMWECLLLLQLETAVSFCKSDRCGVTRHGVEGVEYRLTGAGCHRYHRFLDHYRHRCRCQISERGFLPLAHDGVVHGEFIEMSLSAYGDFLNLSLSMVAS